MRIRTNISRIISAPRATGLGVAVRRATMTVLAVMLTATAAWADGGGTFDHFTWAYTSSTQTLTITTGSSDGNMNDAHSGDLSHWDSYKNSIQHLVIGSGITHIGNYVFDGHTALQDVTFEAGSTLGSIGQYAFHGCTSLTSITLPGNLETIGGNAFNACTGLTSITIPASVTTIESYAFYDCSQLKTCTILSSQLTYIAERCFSGCSSLEAIAIPEGVTTIGERAFTGCTRLKSVALPGSLKTIRAYAFQNCSDLKTVFCKVVNPGNPDDPQKLTIDNNAFSNSTEFYLSSSADISAWEARGFSNLTYNNTPYSWTSGDTDVTLVIDGTLTVSKKAGDGSGAMDGSGYPRELKDYIKKVVIESGVTTIDDDAFRGCTALTSVTIADGVTTIEEHAFMGCTALTSVTIPASVTTIEEMAFMGCTALTSVAIPASVTTIGDGAFMGCTALTSVAIPASVTTIGVGAFRDCTALTSVTIFAPPLTKYGSLAFANNAADCKIFVPSGSVDAYKTGWNDYATAIEPLDYIIDEDKDVSILSNGNGKNVALKRAFPKGKKQTVCLPFAPGELLKYGKVWEFTGISGGKAVMTQRTSGLQANTPYIFEATNDLLNITFPSVGISIGSDPKTADATAGFTFHGTYAQKIWEATSDEVTNGTIYGFMMQDNDGQQVGQFVKARRRTILRPFSCYLEYNGALDGTQNAAARRMTRGEGETLPDVIDIVWLSANGETTGMRPTPNPSLNGGEWYDLQGRKLSGKPSVKGLYINNGRKVVIK